MYYFSIRSLGSAALNMCSVASGKTDAYWEYGIHVWDIAAGCIIVKEAGGVLSCTDGRFACDKEMLHIEYIALRCDNGLKTNMNFNWSCFRLIFSQTCNAMQLIISCLGVATVGTWT